MNKVELESKIIEIENVIGNTANLLTEKEQELSRMENDPLAYFEDEITTDYDSMLNETYEEVFEALPFNIGDPSEAMKEHDNCHYRCGLNDFADGYDVRGFMLYAELSEEIEDLKSYIEELESELEEWQLSLDILEEDEE